MIKVCCGHIMSSGYMAVVYIVSRSIIGLGNCMQPLVSVIIPVYNVEEYIVRCLDSLCTQSLQDIEIILVDDGTPDRCGYICEEYAKKDDHFKVIHHPVNSGLSVARNTGIANANGEYLMFVDSDDWVDEDFCRIPYECATRNQADLVLFRFRYVDANIISINNIKSSVNYVESHDLLNSGKKTTVEALDLLHETGIGVTAWNKLYRKNLFNNVLYPIGYMFEDLGTTYKTVLKASSIYYLDKVLYYKCENNDGITSRRTKKALQDWFEMCMQQYRDLTEWGGYTREKLDTHLFNDAMTYCIRKKRDLSDKQYEFCVNKLLSCERMPESVTWRRKAMFSLFKHSPFLFELVCTIFGRKYEE